MVVFNLHIFDYFVLIYPVGNNTNMDILSLSFRDALINLGFVRITGLLLHGEHGYIQFFFPESKYAGVWGKSEECLVICTRECDVWVCAYSKDLFDNEVFEKVIRPGINAKPNNELVLSMLDFSRQSIRTSDLLQRKINPDWKRV